MPQESIFSSFCQAVNSVLELLAVTDMKRNDTYILVVSQNKWRASVRVTVLQTGNSSTEVQDNRNEDENNDTSEHSAHFDVQQQLIIDSSGVRVQIMRVVKLGHANEPVDLSEHLNSLFNSLTDLTIGFDGGDDSNSEIDGNFRETKFTDNFDDSADQFWMKLVDDRDQDKENGVHSSNKEGGNKPGDLDHLAHVHIDSETTTTVMKASHKLKVPMKEKVNYPPGSIFARLAPSRDRYTILRDEL